MMKDEMLENYMNSIRHLLAAGGHAPQYPFNEHKCKSLIDRYKRNDTAVSFMPIVLNCAVVFGLQSAEYQEMDFGKARLQLEKIRNQATLSETEIADLNPASLYAISNAKKADKLSLHIASYKSSTAIMLPENVTQMIKILLCDEHINEASGHALEGFQGAAPLSDDQIKKSLRIARKGRRGGAKREQLDELLVAALGIFEKCGDKRFTLDWHKDNSPISEAARFCVDIVEIAFPNVPRSLVKSASRKVREKCKNINTLDDMFRCAADFLQVEFIAD